MSERIIVIGGGICGLAITHSLAKDGHQVMLLEAGEQLGGLGTFFKSGDQWVDKFYHCQMPSDAPLLEFIEDVGLADQMYWKRTRMGFIVDGQRYPFNTALDLLRFKPISFLERIRFGLASLFLRPLGKGWDLDHTRIQEWLTRLYGDNIWKKILEPLFRSKFGAHAGNLPALYIWQRLGREKNTAKRGYLSCGLKGFIDTIEQKIRDYSGDIRCNAAVARISKTNNQVTVTLSDHSELHADRVISTMPIPQFTQAIAGSEYEQHFKDPALQYQGVVNMLFFLSRPLDNCYWTPVLNSNTDFDGVVEMTELVDTTQLGNRHLVYVMKYCDRNSDLFKEETANIADRWQQQLVRLYGHLDLKNSDIVETRVFKAPFVEPVYPLGYSDLKPQMSIGGDQLLLATSAQVYPSVTSWNASVGLANTVIEKVRQVQNQ